MIPKVDWFQFSLHEEVEMREGRSTRPHVVWKLLSIVLPELNMSAIMPSDLGVKPAPFPYQFSLEVWEGCFFVFWGGQNSHPLVRFTGQGCDKLRKIGALVPLAKRYHERVSRIDFAVDMECATTPEDFAKARRAGRVRTHGFMTSPSGDTVTIGSRTSDVFCRVYRYNPPHPRSKFLRAEIECKGDAARSASLILTTQGEQKAVFAAHERLAWLHPDWQPDEAVAPLSVARPTDKAGRKELYWLYNQVVPALRRYIREGILDTDGINDLLIAVYNGQPPNQ